MTAFVLELYRPGLDRAGGTRLVRSIRRAVAGSDARAIRYGGSTLALRDEVCYVRIEASDRVVVERLVADLAIEGARVSEVVDLG
jgi:hypothetical protein